MNFDSLKEHFDLLPFPAILIDNAFRVLDWNNSAAETFKYSKSEAIGENVIDLIVPDVVTELPEFESTVKKIGAGEYTELVNENTTKHGEKLICHWYNRVIYNSSNVPITLSIAKDVTTEKAYYQDKLLFESLISQTPSMITLYNDFKPVYANESFSVNYGGTLSENNSDLYSMLSYLESSEYIDSIIHLKNGESIIFDAQIKHNSSKYFLHVVCFCILVGSSMHHALVMNDFTETFNMNKEIEQSKKLLTELDVLASLGTMTAGLMHEVNNPLGYVISNIEFLKSIYSNLNYEENEEMKEEIDETFHDVEVGITQILGIVRNIKGFVRVENQEEKINLSQEIESVVTLAKNDYKYDCDVILDLDKSITLNGPTVRFRQIVFNLLSNSIYAIKEKESKTNLAIKISLERVDENIKITFFDQGVGIKPEKLDNIFEAFNTTKPKGVGTGLGLSLIKEYVENIFHGNISVVSQPGVYTEFTLEIPSDLGDSSVLDDQINCWEFMKCGREIGGVKSTELGICPVLHSSSLDGVHNGKFAGRTCWIVSGTLCGSRIQGSHASKIESCRTCDFYKLVKAQERSKLKSTEELLELVKSNSEEMISELQSQTD